MRAICRRCDYRFDVPVSSRRADLLCPKCGRALGRGDAPPVFRRPSSARPIPPSVLVVALLDVLSALAFGALALLPHEGLHRVLRSVTTLPHGDAPRLHYLAVALSLLVAGIFLLKGRGWARGAQWVLAVLFVIGGVALGLGGAPWPAVVPLVGFALVSFAGLSVPRARAYFERESAIHRRQSA